MLWLTTFPAGRLSSCQQELQQAQEEVRKAEAKLQHTVEALASRTAQVRELETQVCHLWLRGGGNGDVCGKTDIVTMGNDD